MLAGAGVNRRLRWAECAKWHLRLYFWRLGWMDVAPWGWLGHLSWGPLPVTSLGFFLAWQFSGEPDFSHDSRLPPENGNIHAVTCGVLYPSKRSKAAQI